MENTKNSSYKMLNLGCGEKFHEDWTNLDVLDYGGKVIQYNLNLGIPFSDDTFDFVYHSHIIEHFEAKRGKYFLKECFRVLKDGATLRIAFPDLEGIVRNYVQALDDIEAGKEDADARREWMTFELYDQVVRNKPNGDEIERFLTQDNVPIKDFIIKRWGEIGRLCIEHFQRMKGVTKKQTMPSIPCYDKQFKESGELHQWMYDFYSMKKILEEIGFTNIQKQTFDNSSFKEYLKYNFDKDNNGNIRKPDSMFIEATKPANTNKKKGLRVAIFNSYDIGGASVAALRQHYALRKIGVNSEFYTGWQKTIKPSVHIVPTQNSKVITNDTGWAYQESFYHNYYNWKGRNAPYPQVDGGLNAPSFCFIHDASVNPHKIPHFDDFDIINLEWVAGFADPCIHPEHYKDIPIVWTLHDMLPLTGGCYYSEKCEKFTEGCNACPILKSSNPYDLSAQIFKKKLLAYKNLNIHIVAPSEWMAEQARKSQLTSHFPVHVIRYAQPLNTFKPIPERDNLRASFQITQNDIVLLFTADTFGVERKGGKHIVKLLQNLAQTELAPRIIAVTLGKDAPEEIKNSGVRTATLGFISDENTLAQVYNIADALIIPSLEDNYPNVICESLACGTPTIAFKSGGIPEMVIHQKTGFLAEKQNDDELLEGVKWLSGVYRNQEIRNACREFALENLDEEKQAKKYEELYYQIIKEKNDKLEKENSLSSKPINEFTKKQETEIIQEEFPLVSVIIPCYNQARFLPDSVASVVNQTYPNIEIIIVNDGSPDNTQEVANNLIKQYGNIRPIKLINKENGGVSSARNAGIKEAKGVYISALDADDLFEKDYIKTGIDALFGKDKNLFSCDVQEFGTSTRTLTPPIYDDYYVRYANMMPTASIFEKSLFEKSHGYNESLWFAEDWDFWINLSRLGVKPVKKHQTLIRYRAHDDDSLRAMYMTKHDDDLIRIMQIMNDDLYSVDEIMQAHEEMINFNPNTYNAAKKKIEKKPDDWFLNLYLGVVAEKQNDFNLALKYYQHANEVTHKKNWQVLFRMCSVLSKTNDTSTLPSLLKEVIILRPDMRKYIN